jgi:hypothetical protein
LSEIIRLSDAYFLRELVTKSSCKFKFQIQIFSASVLFKSSQHPSFPPLASPLIVGRLPEGHPTWPRLLSKVSSMGLPLRLRFVLLVGSRRFISIYIFVHPNFIIHRTCIFHVTAMYISFVRVQCSTLRSILNRKNISYWSFVEDLRTYICATMYGKDFSQRGKTLTS